MATLAENITQAINDFDSIQQAIIDKGVNVSSETPTSLYGEKIKEIKEAGEIKPPSDKWEINPNWNWYDFKKILAEDETPYQYRVAEMIYDIDSTTAITISGNLVAVRTSDGVYYTTSTTHIWDTTQDRQMYVISQGLDGSEIIAETAKARYLIKYYSTEKVTLTIGFDCFYFVADSIKFTNIGLGNETIANAKRLLIAFDLINGANLHTSVSDTYSMFHGCISLVTIPQLDTSKITDMSYMFYGCTSLMSIPQLDMRNVLSTNNMFTSCVSLTTIPLLDISKSMDISSMFNGCVTLTTVPQLNMQNVQLGMAASPFNNCTSLVSVYIKNLKVSTTIGTTSYGLFINRNSLINIFNNVTDLTGLAQQTLTIGATNLAKLTEDEKAIITSKNWKLA